MEMKRALGKIKNLFSQNKGKQLEHLQPKTIRATVAENIEGKNIEELNKIKIGVLVRSTLTKMLKSHKISEEEIELMQTAEYSKLTFDIQYPLLRKATLSNLSLIHISEPTRRTPISYAVFC